MAQGTPKRRKRVSIYISDELQTGFEEVYERMKEQGLVPLVGSSNKHRTAMILLCVRHYLEDTQLQGATRGDGSIDGRNAVG